MRQNRIQSAYLKGQKVGGKLRPQNQFQGIPSLREPKKPTKKGRKADPVALYQNMKQQWQKQKQK